MNGLNQYITDDGDRMRIAARTDIDVYVPRLDENRFVSDVAGDYWPYRTVSFEEACDNPKAVSKTRRRTDKLRLVDNRPPGSNFPIELFELADECHADEVLPVSYTGSSRDAIADAVRLYSNYDFKSEPTLIIPIVPPFEMTGSCVKHLLYDTDQSTGLRSINSPSDFAIRGLSPQTQSYEQLKEILTTADSALEGGVNVNIHAPPVNIDLVRIVRNYGGLINSITLPRDAQSSSAVESASYLSSKGSENLTDDTCPLVQIAGELSLLTSDLIKSDRLEAALSDSIIPTLGPNPTEANGSAERQSTFS